jgi:hypothetical protein
MHRAALVTLFILAVAVEGLAQRQRAVPPSLTGSDWKIEISTTGGFTGGGNGGLIVSSDGNLVITFGASPGSKRCTFQLTKGELQMIDAAVRSANPAVWSECYSLADMRTHCCDLIRTTLSLSLRGGRDQYVTSWLMSVLPTDLQSLYDVLRGPAGIDARYRPLCATMS